MLLVPCAAVAEPERAADWSGELVATPWAPAAEPSRVTVKELVLVTGAAPAVNSPVAEPVSRTVELVVPATP